MCGRVSGCAASRSQMSLARKSANGVPAISAGTSSSYSISASRAASRSYFSCCSLASSASRASSSLAVGMAGLLLEDSTYNYRAEEANCQS
eukprot:scaffold4928_cov32-Tisochrysis_lutea.AAC.2